MPESLSHANLVSLLAQYITVHYLSGHASCILSDTSGFLRAERCFEINGFLPDIEAFPLSGDNRLIIGEAKSSEDIDRSHSKKQYVAFLKYCEENAGSFFILAVPWQDAKYARSLLKQLSIRNSLDASTFMVIDNMSK